VARKNFKTNLPLSRKPIRNQAGANTLFLSYTRVRWTFKSAINCTSERYINIVIRHATLCTVQHPSTVVVLVSQWDPFLKQFCVPVTCCGWQIPASNKALNVPCVRSCFVLVKICASERIEQASDVQLKKKLDVWRWGQDRLLHLKS
jgi:hypothetical protein